MGKKGKTNIERLHMPMKINEHERNEKSKQLITPVVCCEPKNIIEMPKIKPNGTNAYLAN